MSKNAVSYRHMRTLLNVGPPDRLPQVALLANAEDERTGLASEIYVFKKNGNRHGHIAVPREEAFNPRALARAIIAKNGLLPRDPDRAAKIVKRASALGPREHWLHAPTGGWASQLRAFSHGNRVIGATEVGELTRKPAISERNRKVPLVRKGTLKGWQEITRVARASSRLRLAICVAFAAPLLKVVDAQSFTIVLAGASKVGKSTALLASGSFIGIGREGGLPNFNTTISALQESAVEFTDRVMPMNETALLKGPKREHHSMLRSLAYCFAEGRDTDRHSKSIYGSDGAPLTWRSIMLVSSEHSYEALAEVAGEVRDDGERARAFDVPAVVGRRKTIFDRVPRSVPKAERASWPRQQLLHIRALAAEHHGRGFEAYVAYLVEHRRELKDQVQADMTAFLGTLEGRPLSGAALHAARNFALLYAGAAMAKRAGLVPSWKLTSVSNALRRCFNAGLHRIEAAELLEDRVARILRKKLRTLRPLKMSTNVKTIDGWVELSAKGKVFCVRTPAFKTWFSGADQERAALRWLQTKKLLQLSPNAKPNLPNTEWAVTFPKANGKGQRCFMFREPPPKR